jgi:hypothetical protein
VDRQLAALADQNDEIFFAQLTPAERSAYWPIAKSSSTPVSLKGYRCNRNDFSEHFTNHCAGSASVDD